jgi:hypothetical protein
MGIIRGIVGVIGLAASLLAGEPARGVWADAEVGAAPTVAVAERRSVIGQTRSLQSDLPAILNNSEPGLEQAG